MINLYLVTRNKSIITTTLHTAMNLHMLCMSKQIELKVFFVTEADRANLNKYIKNTTNGKFVWIDYGVTLDIDTLTKLAIDDFPETYRVLTVPCVTEGVDWKQFREKTLLGTSSEPIHQRGLKFDTTVTDPPKKFADKIYDYVSGEPRVFCIADCKALLKKIEGGAFKSFDHMKRNGVKIGVLKSCTATCHYVYECFGNILDSSGVRAGP